MNVQGDQSAARGPWGGILDRATLAERTAAPEIFVWGTRGQGQRPSEVPIFRVPKIAARPVKDRRKI
jgi:hypothetical protein